MTIALRAQRIAAGGALIAVVAAGCGSTSPATSTPAGTASPTTTAPSITPTSPPPSAAATTASTGPAASLPLTGRIEVPDKGFALTLPTQWTRIDLGPNGLSEILKASASSLPENMANLLNSQIGTMAASGVSIFAFRSPDASMPAGTTLNVLSLPSLGLTIDTYESLVVGQLKSVLGQDVEVATARVKGPAGEFLRLTYDLKVTGSPTSIGTVQYLFISPTHQYVISCGTPGPTSAVQAECESIATTLEILS